MKYTTGIPMVSSLEMVKPEFQKEICVKTGTKNPPKLQTTSNLKEAKNYMSVLGKHLRDAKEIYFLNKDGFWEYTDPQESLSSAERGCPKITGAISIY